MKNPYRNSREIGNKFWNKEYKRGVSNTLQGKHIMLSINPSEDFVKFTRWLERNTGCEYLKPVASALDLGCGNGRNLFFLSQEFGCRGVGYDISQEAIAQAKKQALAEKLNLSFEVRDIKNPLQTADKSQTLVMDMMSSHFLNFEERNRLMAEISRVLRPDGWFFLKTFLLDEDMHAKRLLREYPAGESGTYIHPEIGIAEHVSTQKEIEDMLTPYFTIHKILKSHRHIKKGQAWKRRSISAYAQRKF